MRLLTLDSRLDAIAGEPAGMLTAPGTTGPLEGFTALGPRTLYLVYEDIGDVGIFQALAELGTSNNVGRVRIQTIPGSGNWSARFDTVGDQNHSASIQGSRGGLKSVVAWWNAGGSGYTQSLGYPVSTVGVLTGDGMEANPPLFLSASAVIGSKRLAAAYPAVHTEYQRKAIMRKLLSMSGA